MNWNVIGAVGEILGAKAVIITKTNERTPGTDVIFLSEFLKENPYGIIEWKRKREEMGLIVPEFCNEIDKLIGN